jgi:2-dehydropantoate 2-reductase
MMRIGIVGVGSLGALLGGLLVEGGFDTILIERDKDHADYIRENGLRLEGVSGDRTLRPEIVSEAQAAGRVDLCIVAVKSYDTASTLPTLGSLLSEKGIVLTLQNGIGNYEVLEAAFPKRVLLGATTMGAMALGKGTFRHTGFGHTRFGEADGIIRERTLEVGRILERMNGGPVEVVENAVGCLWSKLIINAAINAPATLLRVRNGDLPKTKGGLELIHRIVEECMAVVNGKGISLVFDDPADQILQVCSATAPNINSMFQDIIACRKTEIDFINGAISKLAKDMGISAHVNSTLTLLIQALEQSGRENLLIKLTGAN